MDAFRFSLALPQEIMVGDDSGDCDGDGLLDLLLATEDDDADGRAALASSAARAGGAGLTGEESGSLDPVQRRGCLGLASSAVRAGGAGLTGEESGSLDPVQWGCVGLSLGLASSAARAGGANYDDMMRDLKLFSKAQLTSYGKRWNSFSSNEEIAMELDIRKMYSRRYGPVTTQVWTGLWERLHSHSISRSSPRGSRSQTHRYRSRSPTQ